MTSDFGIMTFPLYWNRNPTVRVIAQEIFTESSDRAFIPILDTFCPFKLRYSDLLKLGNDKANLRAYICMQF